MKSITHNQYLQLIGLKTVCEKHNAMCTATLEAAAEITGEDMHGHMSDILFGGRPLDEGLRLMEIEVLPRPAPQSEAGTP